MLTLLLSNILTVQIVYSVQLTVLTVITQTQSDCNIDYVNVQHIECTDSFESAADLY